ncbi:MAG: serine hydrolase domain-containing protein [Candidatus Hodarchaeota archaeon]
MSHLKNTFFILILLIIIISLGGCITNLPETEPPFTEPPITEPPAIFEWTFLTPDEQGVSSEILDNMTNTVTDENINVHSIIIVKNSSIIYETYFSGFNENMKHEIWSCTKSVTSALIGIAIDQGMLSLNDIVIDLFPNKTFQNTDARKERLEVKDMLTMTTGLEWAGDTEYISLSTNQVPDWVQYVLDKPMVAEPGEVFNYHTGASHVLGAIIEIVSGMETLEYAKQFLFEPLGIEKFSWTRDTQGNVRTGSGLSILPRDMAKFGLLYLNNGTWMDEQILSSAWVEASTESHVGEGWGYGYQWWVYHNIEINDKTISKAYAARGYLDQVIFVIQELDLIIVMTSNNLGDLGSDYLIANFILPAVLG